MMQSETVTARVDRRGNRPAQHRALRLALALALCAMVAGCAAASKAFNQGKTAANAGEWDVAIEQYRQALQADPENVEYRMALTRAMASASVDFAEKGRIAELRLQNDEALRNYRKASEYDPSNRQLAAKVTELERKMRAATEAAQPRPAIQQLRESARQTTAATPALVGLNEVLPTLSFTQASVRDILNFVGRAAGINVTFERDYADPRPYTLEMTGVTLEQALNQLTTANQLFYKVVNPRTVMIINDNQQKRSAYDEQVIKVLRLSHADATEVMAMLQQVVRIAGAAQTVQFSVSANKTSNSLTIRAPLNVAQIIERVVESVDTPRAEVVVEVEILEVRKSRLKQYGLDLGNYTIGMVYSPDSDPRNGNGLNSPPFGLGSIINGVNRGDFYLTVPPALIRFLENDSQTKLLAKTQLRGAEGQKMTLNLGEEVPVPTTVYTPIAQGGANVNPLSSFNYRTVGIVLEATPRVTYEDEIVLEMVVENSARGADSNVGGTNLPTFATRKVTGQLRLRDGEANLLAGLLQDNERRSLTGFPGILRLPVIKQLFSANDITIEQTDIVMLMTPRIIRSHELTQADVEALFIGTSTNLGIGGPPPLIAQPPVEAAPGATGNAPAPGAAPGPGLAPAAPAAQPPAPGAPGPAQPGGAAVPGPPPPAPAPAPQPAPQATPPPQSNANPPVATPPAAPPAAPAATASTAAAQTGAQTAALTPAGAGGGQIVATPSAPEMRVGTNGYPVALTVVNASRLSSVTLTLTYNPAVLRVRSVQQGSFMSSAGSAVAFTQDSANPGRVDIVITRSGDSTGASGSGLLGSVLFDAIGAGAPNLAITGTAAAPGGARLQLQFAPVTPVIVR